MTLVFRSLVLTVVLALAAAGTVVNRGQRLTAGTSSQSAETGATSVQTSSGDGQGQQTNQGEARGVSLQREETGPGGNVQEINNQAVVQALQQADGSGGGVLQSSNNQINIKSDQLQQNVNGTLVNVQTGREGVVIINANDLSEDSQPGDASVLASGNGSSFSVEQQSGLTNASQTTSNQGVIQALQQLSGAGGEGLQDSNVQVNLQATQEQENVEGTLVNVGEGHLGVVIINTNDETGAVVNQTVINDKPIAEETEDSARCRYVCPRPSREFYCCDHGFNQDLRTSARHPGQCQQPRPCDQISSFVKCASDSQCAESEVCCYDGCAEHHVCQQAVLGQ